MNIFAHFQRRNGFTRSSANPPLHPPLLLILSRARAPPLRRNDYRGRLGLRARCCALARDVDGKCVLSTDLLDRTGRGQDGPEHVVRVEEVGMAGAECHLPRPPAQLGRDEGEADRGIDQIGGGGSIALVLLLLLLAARVLERGAVRQRAAPLSERAEPQLEAPRARQVLVLFFGRWCGRLRLRRGGGRRSRRRFAVGEGRACRPLVGGGHLPDGEPPRRLAGPLPHLVQFAGAVPDRRRCAGGHDVRPRRDGVHHDGDGRRIGREADRLLVGPLGQRRDFLGFGRDGLGAHVDGVDDDDGGLLSLGWQDGGGMSSLRKQEVALADWTGDSDAHDGVQLMLDS
mmetsp:Transcript_14706/g.28142  ORF Transcript_14706/g.28142 Transcript_14706/m.28142 type:complete len:343 (-) Transcript_14706:149-1177(-)